MNNFDHHVLAAINRSLPVRKFFIAMIFVSLLGCGSDNGTQNQTAIEAQINAQKPIQKVCALIQPAGTECFNVHPSTTEHVLDDAYAKDGYLYIVVSQSQTFMYNLELAKSISFNGNSSITLEY